MLIFDDIKLVYLANPKTGTTSFEHAFEKFANAEESQRLAKHAPFRRFKRKFPDMAKEYEVVTCLRDPLETLYSWYRYRARVTIRGQSRSTYGMTFEEFFAEWCKPDPAPYAGMNGSVSFVLNKKGKVVKRLKIFKYGASNGLHEYVAGKMGIVVPDLQKNVSRASVSVQRKPLAELVDTKHEKLRRVYDIFDSIKFENPE